MKRDNVDTQWVTFTHNIRWLRKRYKISKKTMSAMLGIGQWTLTKLERGEVPPRLTMEIVIRIHLCFGLTPSDQFSRRME